MAELAAIATIVSTVATAAGSFVQARGAIAAGKAQKRAADYEAAQLDIKAKEEQAVAQRESQEYKRRKDLALSELQAKSAGSGFTATDPTSLALADEIARYGTYQQQLTQYGGQSRRTGIEAQAQGRRMEGKAALQGAKYSAAGTILGGISSIAGNFAKSGSPATGSYRYG